MYDSAPRRYMYLDWQSLKTEPSFSARNRDRVVITLSRARGEVTLSIPSGLRTRSVDSCKTTQMCRVIRTKRKQCFGGWGWGGGKANKAVSGKDGLWLAAAADESRFLI